MNMKYRGLTLIELMVTLAVISIVLALGVPQFKSITAGNRLTSAINTLSGDLTFARTEAVKRGRDVTVTGSTDWASSGWTVAVNNSGTTNLRITPALGSPMTISTTPANTTVVTFSPDGRSDTAVTFKLCDDRSGNLGKKITLKLTGQTFLETKQTCP